jgi:hypothetical protein
MRYEIRALRLGEILDQSINLLKDHFSVLLTIVGITLGPVMLLGAALRITMFPDIPVMMGQQMTPEEAEAMFAAFLKIMPALIGLQLLTMIAYPLANAALVHAIAQSYLGKPVTVGSSIGSAFRLLLPLFWTWFLVGIAIIGGTILCVIPGIIAAFWLSLATQVVVVEKISGFAALHRSREIMRGNIADYFVLMLVVGLISGAAGAAGGFVPQPHLREVLGILIQLAATIFGSAAIVIFYFSARCRNEQFDLQLLAKNIGSGPTGPYEPEDVFESEA